MLESRAMIETRTQKYNKAVAHLWRNFPCPEYYSEQKWMLILLCESHLGWLGPRPGGIWAFVRSICAILKGFQPHEANFKSGECLAFWPHEPHDAHSLRRENFGTSSFGTYFLFCGSKQKPADASNFVGSRKISLDQIYRMNPELWSKHRPKIINRRWPRHDVFSPVRSITLWAEWLP